VPHLVAKGLRKRAEPRDEESDTLRRVPWLRRGNSIARAAAVGSDGTAWPCTRKGPGPKPQPATSRSPAGRRDSRRQPPNGISRRRGGSEQPRTSSMAVAARGCRARPIPRGLTLPRPPPLTLATVEKSAQRAPNLCASSSSRHTSSLLRDIVAPSGRCPSCCRSRKIEAGTLSARASGGASVGSREVRARIATTNLRCPWKASARKRESSR
jgi:hypothetical protein